MDWQTLVAGSAALVCGAWLTRRAAAEVRSRGRAGCGTCGRCGAPCPGAGLLQVMDDRVSDPPSPAVRSGRTTSPEAE